MQNSEQFGKLLRQAQCRPWHNWRFAWPTESHVSYSTSNDPLTDPPTISIDRSGLFNVDGKATVTVEKEPETPLAKQLKALIQVFVSFRSI